MKNARGVHFRERLSTGTVDNTIKVEEAKQHIYSREQAIVINQLTAP